MSAIVPEPPTSKTQEEWLKFRAEAPPDQGRDVVVVSGYAWWDHPNNKQMTGSDEHDFTLVDYDLRLFVGPRWRQLNDVSPIAFIAGFTHHDSDDADGTGMRLGTCTWAWIEGPENPKRQIQLVMGVEVAGGPDAEVRAIGYHLTARGSLMPNQKFGEIT